MLVRIKSDSIFFNFFVIACNNDEEVEIAIEMAKLQIERIYNSLDFGSDEEKEFQSQSHEVIVIDELEKNKIEKREKDEDVFIFGPY
jgi:hypothetical protein